MKKAKNAAKDCIYRIRDQGSLGTPSPSPPPPFIRESMRQPKHIICYFKGNPSEIPIYLEFFREFDFAIFKAIFAR